eukprot:983564_1
MPQHQALRNDSISGVESVEGGLEFTSSDGHTHSECNGDIDSDSSASPDSSFSADFDEEPKLKYERLGAGVSEILKADRAACFRAHEKFLVLGTASGSVHILDFNGYEIKRFNVHSGRVNDVAVDLKGDYIASCADDGKIFVINLFSPDQAVHSYLRPVMAVALHPRYGGPNTVVASGGRGQQLILNTKGWFSAKDQVLQAGEGPVYAIRWCGDMIAWANDLGVKIYDMSTNERVSWIARPHDSPSPDKYHCSICWEDDVTLLIGWANSVKVGLVQTASGPGCKRGVLIVASFQTDFFVCGIAPFGGDLLLLSFVEYCDTDSDSDTGMNNSGSDSHSPEIRNAEASQHPELHVVTRQNAELSSDSLPIQGYERLEARDYRLDALVGSSESLFYVISPKDIVLARPRDADDHIDWLLDEGRALFEEAYVFAKERARSLKRHDLGQLGQRYLESLILAEDFSTIPIVCPELFGHDAAKWEFWILQFAKLRLLRVLISCIPTTNPKLNATVYEMILNYFLVEDHSEFLSLVRRWPHSLYSPDTIIQTVLLRLQEGETPPLMDSLAELYQKNGMEDRALSIYLQTRKGDVFGLIEKYDLFSNVKDKVVELMEFDKDKAIELFRTHSDQLPVQEIVRQLEHTHDRYLYEYLHVLFTKDNFSGSEFHNLQVKLYAKYSPDELLPFLRGSNFYTLEDAYRICKERRLVPEMVFILGRMGNTTDALLLIINELKDVKQAIEFVEEHRDEGLWEYLVRHSLMDPQFVSGLLDHIGAHHAVDPKKLISQLPSEMKIPQLKEKLLRIMSEYLLEMSLRRGANQILKSDCFALLERLNRIQKRAVCVNSGTTTASVCSECGKSFRCIPRNPAPGLRCIPRNSAPGPSRDDVDAPIVITFFCGHVYHEACLVNHEGTTNHLSGSRRRDRTRLSAGLNKLQSPKKQHRCVRCSHTDRNSPRIFQRLP